MKNQNSYPMKNLTIIALLILSPIFGEAQNFADALRFSSNRLEGTARAGAMGNAFGSLGGDFTAVSINPAGLGIYRAGEFAFTPSFSRTDVDASYLNTNQNDYQYNLKFSNLSYVGTIRSAGSESGLVSVNLGFGFNRLNDFNTRRLVQGARAQSSFLDYIADNANYNLWSEFYEELAWKTDLLLFDLQGNEYYHDIQDAGYGQSQRKSYNYAGSTDEYTFSLGLNFNYRFYLGASFGISDLAYTERTMLREWDEQNNIPFFNEMKFSTSLRTYGTGYNFKVGAIFRPLDQLRLGLAFHSPTFYRLRDNFETTMESSITYSDGSETYKELSPYLDYEYRLETPFKTILSASYIVGKKGLLSADYEYLNFGKARLRDGGGSVDFVPENNDISDLFKATGIIRVGGEYKLTELFALRAGTEYHPSAYNSRAFNTEQPNSNFNYTVYSAGFGYRSGSFFADLAYRYAVTGDYNYLYPVPAAPYPMPEMAKFDQKTHKVLLTFGLRF